MKKILLAGIVILIAVFAVTCDEGLSDDNAIVEYTDVVVSKDGSQVTIYLDGVTVPVTKAQRAMTLGLAMMSYDYLEVVFRNATGVPGATPGHGYSRTVWELGQPAGISGSGLRTGEDYGSFGTPGACLFAGKKDGKTLFGVGKMVEARDINGALQAAGDLTKINSSTGSVTFELAAIQTGLLIGTDTVTGTYATKKIPVDSFTFTTATWTRDGHSSYQTLADKVAYPTYNLPTDGTAVNATYDFKFMRNLTTGTLTDITTTGGYLSAILHVDPTIAKAKVMKRTPRFMDGGRYMQPNSRVDTKTTVTFGAIYTAIAGAATTFKNSVDLMFTPVSGNTGIFSFYLEIPVYNLDIRNLSTSTNLNSGPGPVMWYIRTGLGSDLYSLDDGESSGGCVFMSTGVSNSDWLSIDWKWIE